MARNYAHECRIEGRIEGWNKAVDACCDRLMYYAEGLDHDLYQRIKSDFRHMNQPIRLLASQGIVFCCGLAAGCLLTALFMLWNMSWFSR